MVHSRLKAGMLIASEVDWQIQAHSCAKIVPIFRAFRVFRGRCVTLLNKR